MSAMMVKDDINSEHGRQRKKDELGRLIHCCVVCGRLDRWKPAWSWYGSDKEIDDGKQVSKFCSDFCKSKGGSKAQNITDEMRAAAREKEYRDPIIRYRPATEQEKYNAALRRQPRSPKGEA